MQQTNRTILFEELNSGKENLTSMIHLSERQESLTDEVLAELHEKLEVKSFREAVEKFCPQVYMRLDTDKMSVDCTRNMAASAKGFRAIPLCGKDGFWEALSELTENKKNRRFVTVSFQDLGDGILPSAPPAVFFKKRDEMLAAVCGNQQKKAKRLLGELVREYDDGIFLVKTFLKQVSVYRTKKEEYDTAHCFVAGTDGSGQVHPIEISARFRSQRSCTKEEEQQYFQFLQECLKEEKLENRRLTELLLNLACPPKQENAELLWDDYNRWLDFYRTMLEKFWREAKPVFEALLGIKNFFDQYTVTDGGMEPTLVITNVKPSFIRQPRQSEALRVYLESVNEKTDNKDTVWYAVLPGAPFRGEEKKPVRERFLSSHGRQEAAANAPGDMCLLAELLCSCRVQCFVSAEPDEESTFYPFVKLGMEPWRETFAFLENAEQAEYLIPCYPNFTVLSETDSMLNLGYETEYDPVSGEVRSGNAKKIWLDGLNVEASYIAAGLIAACQCPVYLKQCHKKHVREGVPGVAYRLCEGENAHLTATRMFKEVAAYPGKLLEEIETDSRGMVFAPWNGRVAAITDRVYSYRQKSPDYIALRQTMTYVERIIRRATQDFKEQRIGEFFQERPGSVIADWKAEPDCVNAVIKNGEDIKYRITEDGSACCFEIRFGEVKKEDIMALNEA